ncbi:MAG: thioredoxin family protein [Crocinitomicaceae bacterium]|nr:thioredoxin family protein [Crocinitomicaceae bacterium]
MRKIIFVLIGAAFILFTSFEKNQKQSKEIGISFTELSYENALKEAKNLNKLIFIDTYADWCKPCKWMDKKTFKDPLVGELFNEHFINLKVDIETQEGENIAKKYLVTSLPTLLFINGNGEVIQRSIGALNPNDLFLFAESVLK